MKYTCTCRNEFTKVFDLHFKEKDRLLSEIGALVPPTQCQRINLIVVGNKGSGKSSLINTFTTVLRNKGHIFNTATTYGIDYQSTTPKVRFCP